MGYPRAEEAMSASRPAKSPSIIPAPKWYGFGYGSFLYLYIDPALSGHAEFERGTKTNKPFSEASRTSVNVPIENLVAGFQALDCFRTA